VRGLPRRNRQREHGRHDRHHDSGRAEHHAPAEMAGHYARNRPRQQDAEQQATHDVADHTATRFVGRQVRRQRNQDLHGNRTEADQQRDSQKRARLTRHGSQRETDDGDERRCDHQLAVFQQVAERDEEEQSQGVADLRQRDDQTGRAARHMNVRCDQFGDRLGVVDVGDDRAAAEGEHSGQAAGHLDGAAVHGGRG
jgi:hypothetical protein